MKPDAAAIRAIVDSLPNRPGIQGTSQAGWPKYLFRVDHVKAAALVLDGGRLYSRNRAVQLGLLTHDAAAPSVIGNSPAWIKDYVRLYFRPKTPTEWHSEGFRPHGAISMGAHRPMPIVMVFDSVPILVADGTKFTAGNAASPSAASGDTATFLQTIPFERVYHAGPMMEAEKSDITFRRCAEVLVHNELDLTHLRSVFCRSQAEHETLIDILSDDAKATFAPRIGVSDRVHYKSWTYIESVDKTRELVTIRFNAWSSTPQPFLARAEFLTIDGRLIGFWQQENFCANVTQKIDITSLNLDTYRVQVTLDGLLAYSGTFGGIDALL